MRKLWTVAITVLLLMALAAPAFADHTHVRMTGNGSCVILAANGHEKYVQLPHADGFVENRQHPLHVNVHLGEPGTRQGETVMWVQGTPADAANCDEYVNG